MAEIQKPRWFESIPLGVFVIIVLAIFSSIYVLLRQSVQEDGLDLWTFINVRPPIYERIIDDWELEGEDFVKVELIEYNGLRRRLLSGFTSGTPLPDILEVERGMASLAWRGPSDAIGFIDLTDRLHEEGIYERINKPSFSPWMVRGRIYGLPEDVHPTLLMYRADVFEAAGINVDELDTWEKFFKATANLVQDFDGDGNIDQFILEVSERDSAILETLILQAGGHLIQLDGSPSLNSALNIRIISRIVDWASGDDVAIGDVDLYSGAGHRLRADGFVLSWVTPDWRSRTIEDYAPSLGGKVKLMPLPAWEEGGRRTSSFGGTMLGFPKSGPNFDASWDFVKRLYFSRELAVSSWEEFSVLTAVKDYWDDPFFDKEIPFYMGQKKAHLYIDQAENVPYRTSSPYLITARQELLNAYASALRSIRSNEIEDPEIIKARTTEALDKAQANLIRQMKRNRFFDIAEGGMPE